MVYVILNKVLKKLKNINKVKRYKLYKINTNLYRFNGFNSFSLKNNQYYLKNFIIKVFFYKFQINFKKYFYIKLLLRVFLSFFFWNKHNPYLKVALPLNNFLLKSKKKINFNSFFKKKVILQNIFFIYKIYTQLEDFQKSSIRIKILPQTFYFLVFFLNSFII